MARAMGDVWPLARSPPARRLETGSSGRADRYRASSCRLAPSPRKTEHPVFEIIEVSLHPKSYSGALGRWPSLLPVNLVPGW